MNNFIGGQDDMALKTQRSRLERLRDPVGRHSVRHIVSRAQKIPVKARIESMRSSIAENKHRRALERDEKHEMVYHPKKIMKL